MQIFRLASFFVKLLRAYFYSRHLAKKDKYIQQALIANEIPFLVRLALQERLDRSEIACIAKEYIHKAETFKPAKNDEIMLKTIAPNTKDFS